MSEQTWLTLAGICSVLKTTEQHIRWLVDNGYLEMLPGSKPGLPHGRFLDPTPAYADRLRLAEMIYRRRVVLPADIDISEKALFTRAEIAQILGWTDGYAHRYLQDNKVPAVKIGTSKTGGLKLYTAKTVRGLLWRRTGRKTSAQRAPFLIQELIDWFRQQNAAAEAITPTDEQFAEDDALQKKLAATLRMKSPAKEQALRELMERFDLAKAAVLHPSLQTAAGRANTGSDIPESGTRTVP